MKKLLIKSEFVITPYSPPISYQPEKWVKGELEVLTPPMTEVVPAIPEKWTKDDLVVFENPLDETFTHHPEVPEIPAVLDESFTYHPAIPEVPEVLEVKEWRVIDQTEGMEDELKIWLAGNIFKYPHGFIAEWIDLTEEWNRKKLIENKISVGKKAKEACENVLALISGYNLNRELSLEQISVMQENFAQIEKALQSGRPSLAKAQITQVVADGILVTQEMKDMALFLLSDY